MSSDKLIEAEAHLYVGVAKADGVISEMEYSHIPIYAEKAQRQFDKMSINASIIERIRPAIRSIMSSPQFRSWDANDHLDSAIAILREIHSEGVWQSRIVFVKNEKGFTESARIDGYVLREAEFIRSMETKLVALFKK